MERRTIGLVLFLVMALSVLAACGQGNNQATPVNSLPTVVQPLGTGTPSASNGLVPQSTGVVSQGQPAQGSALISQIVNEQIAGDNGAIGKIMGALLDSKTGQLEYLAVDTMGPSPTRHVLVPWGAFQVVTLPDNLKNQATAPAVYLKSGISDLSTVPEVNYNQLKDPKSRPASWASDTQNYWASKVPGLPVTGNQTSGLPVFFTRQESAGPAIKDNQGNDLGTMDDAILNAGGQVQYALLKPGAFGDVTSRLIPIPWNQLSWSADTRAFTLSAPADALKAAPRYDPKNVPAFTSPGWDAQWNQYWKNIKQ